MASRTPPSDSGPPMCDVCTGCTAVLSPMKNTTTMFDVTFNIDRGASSASLFRYSFLVLRSSVNISIIGMGERDDIIHDMLKHFTDGTRIAYTPSCLLIYIFSPPGFMSRGCAVNVMNKIMGN